MQNLFDRISRKLKVVLFGHYRPDFDSAWLEQNGHAMYCEVVVDHDRGHPLEFSGEQLDELENRVLRNRAVYLKLTGKLLIKAMVLLARSFVMTPLLIFALFWLVSDNAADYQGLAQRIADPASAGILFQKAFQWCLSLNLSVAVYLWVVRGFHHDWKDSIFERELIRNMLTQYEFDRQSWDTVSLRFSSKPKTD
ncbi:hypothetical protein [Eikenella corrodens]|uniref:Uncharacterized protein n=1 Tax=Eikenella corrodens TaxID=539 RepID=A0A3S9SJM5_EIKCO|nr:hypothetical protein [Eikenella corrodens]AZR59743.1 hypothetical protein ELB75_06745 [Eikenella corrodens]